MHATQKLLASFFVFSLLIVGFLHPISAITQDLGRHLLIGELILQTGSVPKTNLLSYTNPDFPFINHHWLSEVIFYLIHTLAGFNGLLIFTILTVTTSFGLLFFPLLKKTNILPITIASLLYLRVLFERTDVRPEIFSFLFLSLFLVILYRYREKYTRWIFLLPFLELLWVNMHIYFIVGIGVIGLFLIDYLIKNRKQLNHHYTSILVVILFASIFATFLNPNGIDGALYPFHVFQNYGYTIEENQTVFFLWNYFGGKTTILYFFISVAALFLTLLLTFKRTRPIDWMLAIFFTALAANAERNFSLFVFGTFTIFVIHLSLILEKATTHIKKLPALQSIILLTLFCLFIWQGNQVIAQKPLGLGVESGAKNGADFLLKKRINGPIFNNFDIGSYLAYRLFPKEKVFIDGRPEAYPAMFIQEVYIPMQTEKKRFDAVIKQYNIYTIFFSHTDQTPWAQTFLKWIVEDEMWKIVYLDDYVIILIKNTEENKQLIQKYAIGRSSLRISNAHKTSLSFLRLANFFRVVGWPEHEEKIYHELLKVDPNSCIALYNLYIYLSQRSDPVASLFMTRFQENCQ